MFIIIALNYLKIQLKSYSVVLILIIMPLVFIITNGTAMEKVFNPTDVPVSGLPETAYVTEVVLKSPNDMPAIQYFSASMLVMFMLFVSTLGASNLMREREENTLMRTFASPVSEMDVLLGKFTGNVLLAVVQASVIILTTWLVFNVAWGNSLLLLIFITLFLIYVAASMAFFISMIVKSSKMAEVVMSAAILLMTFISGGFIPVDTNKILNIMSNFTINKWAFEAYRKIMSGKGINDIAIDLLVLFVLGSIFTLISVYIFKKRGVVI